MSTMTEQDHQADALHLEGLDFDTDWFYLSQDWPSENQIDEWLQSLAGPMEHDDDGSIPTLQISQEHASTASRSKTISAVSGDALLCGSATLNGSSGASQHGLCSEQSPHDLAPQADSSTVHQTYESSSPTLTPLGSFPNTASVRDREAPDLNTGHTETFALTVQQQHGLRPLLPALGKSRLDTPQNHVPDEPTLERRTLTLPPKRRRGKMNEQGRKKVKDVRGYGACVRCRIYGLQCATEEPCPTCQKVTNTAVFYQPCSHDSLDMIMTFRAGNSRAGQYRAQLPETLRWTTSEIRTIDLQYQFKPFASGTALPTLRLTCREFVPRVGQDYLEDAWREPDGSVRSLMFPAFACDVDHGVTIELRRFLQECRPLLQLEMDSNMQEEDEMTRITLEEAARCAALRPDGVVDLALRLRVYAYFSRRRLLMTRGDVIPLPKENGVCYTFPSLSGRVPVPSVLDLQIDTLTILYMSELLQNLVRGMKGIIYKSPRRCKWQSRDKERWYELFLCCYVLLETLEHVYILQNVQLKLHEVVCQSQYNHAEVVTMRMVQEWRHSANILLYHFRWVARGNTPFDGMEKKDLEEVKAGLDESAAAYLHNMVSLVEDQKEDLTRARKEGNAGSLEGSKMWLSQLLLATDQ